MRVIRSDKRGIVVGDVRGDSDIEEWIWETC